MNVNRFEVREDVLENLTREFYPGRLLPLLSPEEQASVRKFFDDYGFKLKGSSIPFNPTPEATVGDALAMNEAADTMLESPDVLVGPLFLAGVYVPEGVGIWAVQPQAAEVN